MIEGAEAVDFPQIALLVAGVESVPAALLLKTVLTDLVHYSSSNYLKGDPAEACDGDLSLCSADVSLEFFASPYGFILTGNNSPSFQQAPADGVEHEGLIAGEVGDLWKDWMRHVDDVLDDPDLLDLVYTTLATRWSN